MPAQHCIHALSTYEDRESVIRTAVEECLLNLPRNQSLSKLCTTMQQIYTNIFQYLYGHRKCHPIRLHGKNISFQGHFSRRFQDHCTFLVVQLCVRFYCGIIYIQTRKERNQGCNYRERRLADPAPVSSTVATVTRRISSFLFFFFFFLKKIVLA